MKALQDDHTGAPREVLKLRELPSRADDWPQWGGPRNDGVWRETGRPPNRCNTGFQPAPSSGHPGRDRFYLGGRITINTRVSYFEVDGRPRLAFLVVCQSFPKLSFSWRPSPPPPPPGRKC